jgi:hypothetical protein
MSQVDYTLTSTDLTALANIVQLQGNIGAKSLTWAGLFDFARCLYWLSYNYDTITSSRLKTQLEQFLNAIKDTTTSYGHNVPAMLVAYMHKVACETGDWNDFAMKIAYGMTWQNRCDELEYLCTAPSNPPEWAKAVHQALFSLPSIPEVTYPPQALICFPPDKEAALADGCQGLIVYYQCALFKPEYWTDADKVAKSGDVLWSAQAKELEDLIKKPSLDDQMFLNVLYLLAGLCTSTDTKVLGNVQTITSLMTNSTENPNDTFIDQLVYFALMEWIDPKGRYQWTHDQLVAALQELIVAVPNGNPESVLLQKTIKQQQAILRATISYPMYDPYNAAVNFPQRKTDTMEALKRAWATLPGQS